MHVAIAQDGFINGQLFPAQRLQNHRRAPAIMAME
jgi:hypothetical protein